MISSISRGYRGALGVARRLLTAIVSISQGLGVLELSALCCVVIMGTHGSAGNDGGLASSKFLTGTYIAPAVTWRVGLHTIVTDFVVFKGGAGTTTN